MSEQTKIEWADSTWSAWEGCTKVGPGCDNCYAENRDNRFGGGHWGPGAPRKPHTDAYWRKPLNWNRKLFIECATCGWRGERRHFNHGENPVGASMCPVCACGDFHPARRRVFCASLSDWLDNEVPIEWLVDLLDLIRQTPNLDWLLLTKRIGNWEKLLTEARARAYAREDWEDAECDDSLFNWIDGWLKGNPPANIWLGATVVNQAEADRDIPKLLQVPARIRFLSVEPMLGAVDLRAAFNGWCSEHDFHSGFCVQRHHQGVHHLHWIICGGESGPHARPMHPDWVRSLRDQCEAAGVPFLFKQNGEFTYEYDRDRDDPDYRRCNEMARLPGRWINLAGGHGFHGERVHYAHRVGKKAAGNLLDGRQHLEWPA